jgi:hypothetical protein
LTTIQSPLWSSYRSPVGCSTRPGAISKSCVHVPY